MSIKNVLWGAPRIHGELLKLGFAVAQSTIAKYMVWNVGPSDQRRATFLRNHGPHIASMDLFVVPTICFIQLYVLVIVRLARRELVWINVTKHPTAEWIAQQITEAFPWNEAPRYLIRDRDAIYGAAVTRRLRAMRIRDKPLPSEDPFKYIEGLVNEKAGHIAGSDPRLPLQNYVTSVNVMALVEAKREGKYKKIIGDATAFLKKLQWDEEEGKNPSDNFYGGAGYDSKSRPDLSNTQMFLDALKEAGVGSDDPALKKALVFVSRCQNLKGEHNDQPWADKINDGSFIYSAAGEGSSKVEGSSPETGLLGYGSMTYAGIKSMIYCGVSKDDARVKKAYEWIQKHYTVDANPGMPKAYAHRGLY